MKENTQTDAQKRLTEAEAAKNERKARHWTVILEQCKARDLKREAKLKKPEVAK